MYDKKRPCVFYRCPNFHSKEHPYQLFKFPVVSVPGSEAEERCKQWIERSCNPAILQLTPFEVSKAQKYVCADHFERRQFHDENRNKLTRNQVPMWNVIHETQHDVGHNAPQLVDDPAPQEEPRTVSPVPVDEPQPPVATQTPEAHVNDARNKVARMSDQRLLQQSGIAKEDLTPRKERMLGTQRKYHQDSVRLLSRMRALRGDIEKMKFSVHNEPLWAKVENSLSPGLQVLIRSERRNLGKEPNGRRFSEDAQAFYLAVYKRGPRVYRFLSQHMTLPSERILKSWLQKIPLNVGINPELVQHLKTLISSWKPLDRKCAVVFDEVALKPHLSYSKSKGYVEGFTDFGSIGRERTLADHALVFMVQGLKRNWKQPFAYFFVNGTCPTEKLVKLIVEVVETLLDIGFCVEASVSDQVTVLTVNVQHRKLTAALSESSINALKCSQGSTNRAAINRLRQLAGELGQYENVWLCKGSLIQHIYDMGHVVKGFRNNHILSDIITPEGVAKWEHIVETVQLDQGFNRMLYKVTEKHINPRGKQKMKVAPACQIYSRSVSATMGTIRKASNGQLLPGTEATEYVVRTIDAAIDLTNGPAGPKDAKGLRKNVTASSPHREEWQRLRRTFREWTFQRKEGRLAGTKHLPPSLKSWIMNLKGFDRLWLKLHGDGLRVWNIRLVNQDKLENFFGGCRQLCGSNTDPTTGQFEAAFKTTVLNDLSSRSRGQNCEEDDAELLSNMRSFLKLTKSVAESTTEEVEEDTSECAPLRATRDQPLMFEGRANKVERQAATYVTGAILRRILKGKTCDTCSKNLTADEVSTDHLFTASKEYDDKRALVYPSAEAINFFLMARINFLKVWVLYNYKRDLKHRVLRAMELADTFEWISCNDHRLAVKDSLLQLTADFYLKTMVKRTNEHYRLTRNPSKQACTSSAIRREDGVDDPSS